LAAEPAPIYAFLETYGGDAALREAASVVANGRIVDVSGKCPGFAAVPSFRKGVVNRNATPAKVIRERDTENARRAKEEG
jgi:hypothetical protein